ncbi:protein tramtrack, beta isoform-like isoform X3 [Homarus americanus]|uniref:protein tramtrack, beta isoform-like isoform X3 n=1 Tax=Homarus americanus TaxID=6706 RepID=UPI001C4548B2|nr:protein tramtrack, beta isoform-like isoform X3 [Homarus americanus]
MDETSLCLRWNDHHPTIVHMLSGIRHKEQYCDATVMCEGRFFPVHKIILAASSTYFEQIFYQLDSQLTIKQPMIVLADIKASHFEAILSYMYCGEVNIFQKSLGGVLHTATVLKVKGLSEDSDEESDTEINRDLTNRHANAQSPCKQKQNMRTGIIQQGRESTKRMMDDLDNQCQQVKRPRQSQVIHPSIVPGSAISLAKFGAVCQQLADVEPEESLDEFEREEIQVKHELSDSLLEDHSIDSTDIILGNTISGFLLTDTGNHGYDSNTAEHTIDNRHHRREASDVILNTGDTLECNAQPNCGTSDSFHLNNGDGDIRFNSAFNSGDNLDTNEMFGSGSIEQCSRNGDSTNTSANEKILSVEENVQPIVTLEVPVKRKPGRPRKVPLPDDGSVNQSSEKRIKTVQHKWRGCRPIIRGYFKKRKCVAALKVSGNRGEVGALPNGSKHVTSTKRKYKPKIRQGKEVLEASGGSAEVGAVQKNSKRLSYTTKKTAKRGRPRKDSNTCTSSRKTHTADMHPKTKVTSKVSAATVMTSEGKRLNPRILPLGGVVME